MEETAQPRSFKLTIKVKSNKNVSKDPTAEDDLDNVAKDIASPDTHEPCIEKNSSEDQEKLVTPDVIDDENEENLSSETSNQLVLYDSAVNGAQAETGLDPEPIGYRSPSLSRPHHFSDQMPRILPSIGAFAVQCAKCFKWRLIPTKEIYEEIREHIMEQPFTCEMATEWRPLISCADDPDIEQDGSRVWAIDKPSIPRPPPGWDRILRIRGVGSSKFADVYYVTPSLKRLRSMVEVQRILDENQDHPDYEVSLSQFSFQTPKPLQENYLRKRPARALTNDSGGQEAPLSLHPSKVEQIGWVSPDLDAELKHGVQIAKKRRSSSTKKKYNSDAILDQNVVKGEKSD